MTIAAMQMAAGLTAISFYLLHFASNFWLLAKRPNPRERKSSEWISQAIGSCGAAAIAAHAALVWHISAHGESALTLSFFNAAMLTTLVVSFIALCSSLVLPVANLLLIIFPLSAISIAMAMGNDPEPHGGYMSLLVAAHALLSLLAYSLMAIAAVQASAIAAQHAFLRRRLVRALSRRLPALETQNQLLVISLQGAFILLTPALLCGVLAIEDLLAQDVAHKTLFSAAAWAMLLAALAGNLRWKWQGGKLVRWTLVTFATLSLGFWGSKLVLELLLHR